MHMGITHSMPAAVAELARLRSRVWLAASLVAALWLGLSGVPAHAGEAAAADSLRCVPGSGVWSEAPGDGGWQLDAAYCVAAWPRQPAPGDDDGACPELVSLRVGAGGEVAQARVATTPRALNNCALRWLGALGRSALYDDGSKILLVDADSLKIVGTRALPRGRVEAAPGGRLALFDDSRLVLLAAGEGEPQIVFDVALERPVALIWQPERLIVVEQGGMRWWSRDADSGLPGGEAQVNAFGQPLGDALWDVDGQGLVRTFSERTKVGWYRFAPDSSFHFSVNAGGVVRAIDGEPSLTVFVSEGGDTKAYARNGQYYRRRYEGRYWGLGDGQARAHGERMALRGEGGHMVLAEGLLAQRAAVLDVSGTTWRRVALLDFAAPGRLVSLDGTRLLTVHPGHDEPLVAHDILTREKLHVVTRAQVRAAGLDNIAGIEALGEDGAWYVVRDEAARPALYDTARNALRGLGAEDGELGAFAPGMVALGESLVFTELSPGGDAVARYHVLSRAGTPLAIAPPSRFEDAMTPAERWFGYCAEGLACQAELAPLRRAEGSIEHWRAVPVSEAPARPVTHALAFLAMSLVLLVGVVLWRTDVGRRGRLDQIQRQQLKQSTEVSQVLPSSGEQRVLDSETLHLGPTTALFDGRGRRYVTDRDADGFVHRTWTHLPWRLGLALMVGAAVAIPMGFVYLVREPLDVSLPWWLALWLPVSAATFLLLSWAVWNRIHLLRYGLAIEGHWYDSGTSRASLCYTMPDGHTYRMRRGQWTRADLVPVVLADPARPRLAAQYTGNGQFPVTQLPGGARLRATSVTLDLGRLCVVLLLSGAAVAGAVHSFGQTFPEPLASWTMGNIEAQAEGEAVPMLGPCLEQCAAREHGAACFEQCQSRQMRRVFEAGGIELTGDPLLRPGALRAEQLGRVDEVRELMASSGAEQSCDDLAATIAQVPRWSAGLESAFAAVYGGELRDTDEQLPQVEARLAELATQVFEPLCRPTQSCLDATASCPQPPSCSGPVERLRGAICGFAVAMTPLQVTAVERNAASSAP